MRIRCPQCHNAISILEDSSFRDVECPTCGSHFNLVGNDALTECGPSKPRKLAHFELREQLGVGHFGSVWKARDTTLDRFVAVKIPRKEHLDESEMEKFFREARAAAQLHHPNILDIHEVGREGDTIFIVSDYVEGASLGEWLGGQPLAPREAATLCAKIADALHVAHEAGVVHRDLKPDNIMMDVEGEPHIMDFGLAKRDTGEVTITIEGVLLGTPAYMSPEQAAYKGHDADRRSDVYSLGVILYEILTSERPFRGHQRMLMLQIQYDEPMPPRRLYNRIPRDLETVCLKCLEKDPKSRFATASELSAELNRFLSGDPVHARPIGPIERIWRWCLRTPNSMSLAAGIYSSLCGIIFGLWECSGLIALAVGIQQPDSKFQAALELIGFTVALFLPLIVIGVAAIRGSTIALWLGLSACIIGLTLSVLLMFGIIELASSTQMRADTRFEQFSLSSWFALAGIGVFVLALIQRYAFAERTGGRFGEHPSSHSRRALPRQDRGA